MEITIKVEGKMAKQFIGFLETLEYVELKKPTKEKSTEPKFEYFGAAADWKPDAKELRASSNRKKSEW